MVRYKHKALDYSNLIVTGRHRGSFEGKRHITHTKTKMEQHRQNRNKKKKQR